jgi:hypothetical protein
LPVTVPMFGKPACCKEREPLRVSQPRLQRPCKNSVPPLWAIRMACQGVCQSHLASCEHSCTMNTLLVTQSKGSHEIKCTLEEHIRRVATHSQSFTHRSDVIALQCTLVPRVRIALLQAQKPSLIRSPGAYKLLRAFFRTCHAILIVQGVRFAPILLDLEQ